MRAIDIVRRACPRARPDYLDAFEAGEADFVAIGGITTPEQQDAFLAQVCHETDGLVITVESMNYSAVRLPQVWPDRFKDPKVAAKYAHDPRALAEKTYGGRMGNGPEGAGDGWAFIGRGLLQITGREAYEKYGKALGIDLAGQPDLAFSAEWSLKIALAEWAASSRRGKTCNEMATAGDFEGITRAINGGLVGYQSRKEWLARVRLARHAADAPDATAPLQLGSRGWRVGALQQRLMVLGYPIGRVDEAFGKETASKVRDFQSDNDLPITGIVDPATQARLDTAQPREVSAARASATAADVADHPVVQAATATKSTARQALIGAMLAAGADAASDPGAAIDKAQGAIEKVKAAQGLMGSVSEIAMPVLGWIAGHPSALVGAVVAALALIMMARSTATIDAVVERYRTGKDMG